MRPTQALADWIADLAGPDARALPGEVEAVLRHALLDTLACGLYGRALPWTRIVERWAGRGSPAAGAAAASVWGDEAPRLRPAEAALVNGVAAHAYELDDYHPAKIHPGAVVIPAALALGEAGGAPGERMLRALAAGYETMIRVSLALDPSAAKSQGWHLTGVTGTLGAAAAACVLLGLDAVRTAWALGLAGTQSSGLFAFTADGAMSKRWHAGDAARAGVVAAELAAAGFTGPTQVLEAPDGGMLGAFSPAPRPEAVTADLGLRWHLLDTAFKPYACCGSLHAHVDAALELRERLGPDRAAAGRVRVGLPRVVAVQCGFDYEPGAALSAQMNARFCVASALRFGRVLPREFADDRLADPVTRGLIDRIEQVHDPELDGVYPGHFCGWVEAEAETGSGEFARAYRHDPSGAASNPGKPRAMREKARELLAPLSQDQDLAGALESACLAPARPDARALVAALRGPAAERRRASA